MLRIVFILHSFCFYVVAYVVSGNSDSGKTKLCHKWSCINGKLNPLNDQTSTDLSNLLSNMPDDWEPVVSRAVTQCKENKHKGYTNTCPGQGMLHCLVTELNKNCPEKYLMNSDFCSPPLSRASPNSTYMFSQSRYDNYEDYAAIEQRPEWFMRSYLNNKCCDIPKLFNSTVLSECDFEEITHYHNYVPLKKYLEYDTDIDAITQETNKVNNVEENYEKGDQNIEDLDPLDCCIVDEFIQPKWRTDCGFKLKWDDMNRLSIFNESDVKTTTTEATSLRNKDVKIVPLPCDKQNCIFSKLNITNDGVIDKDAFSRLLDTMTHRHTQWTSAKAKVVTQCLNKPLLGYEEDCEINRILACTYDILTENCPNANKNDPCKHSTSVLDGLICQISSSKYRPRHRRQFCNVPEFVSSEVREECGVNLIYQLEYVSEPPVRSSKWIPVVNCKDLSQQTTCILSKMNVLNKYGFIDHFKMQDSIGFYAEDFPSILQKTYKNAFNNDVLYPHECSSTKKLLNVIDSMIRTCPYSQLKQEQRCLRLMTKIKHATSNVGAQRNLEQKLPLNISFLNPQKTTKRPRSSYKSNPLYNFGIFGSDNIPKVNIIDLNKYDKTEKTLVLLPVYENYKKPLGLNSLHNDGILRS